MASGQNMQLAKQIGEYLAAVELCRRGFISATFSGNVPHLDILASNVDGQKIAVQVKAIRGGSWQFNIKTFVDATVLDDGKQKLGKKTQTPYPDLFCVFIVIGINYGKDQFYIFTWKELQEIMINKYQEWLDKHGGKRPRKKDSYHAGLKPEHIYEYKNNWNILFS